MQTDDRKPGGSFAQSKPNVSPGKMLAAIVGAGVATALLTSVPYEESGRTVEVTMDASDTPTVRNVSGREYLSAYLDIVGVATACDGLTYDEFGHHIKLHQGFTEAQCSDMLARALVATARGVMGCTPGLALERGKTADGPRFAAVSGAYNYGTGAYCKSTAHVRFNERRYVEGCNALALYNRAGGRVVKGLVDRRNRERNVCLNGLGVRYVNR